MIVLIVAAASLAVAAAPTYDPLAWLVWGREIAHLDLVTSGGGPAWKPLPVLFTTVFSSFGDAAPALWLVVARAGGLLTVALCYRLASRVAGPLAGVVAAVAMCSTAGFLGYLMPGGLSEPLCAGLALLALERHLDGHGDHALLALFAAALLRPETWPFLGAYAAYRVWTGASEWWIVIVLAGALPLAWLLPDYLGSGDWLRSAHRAANPTQGGPLLDRHPALAVLRNAWLYSTVTPLKAALVVGVLVGALRAYRRRGGWLVCGLAALAGAWVAVEAALTELHVSSGDLRYLIVAGALGSVLAGVGVAWLWSSALSLLRRAGVGRRPAQAAAVACLAALLAASLPAGISRVRDLRRDVRHDVALWDNLSLAITRAGGARAIRSCGQIATGPYSVPNVAWDLHVHLEDVGLQATPPGTLFRTHILASSPLTPADAAGYAPAAAAGYGDTSWVISARCRSRAQLAAR